MMLTKSAHELTTFILDPERHSDTGTMISDIIRRLTDQHSIVNPLWHPLGFLRVPLASAVVDNIEYNVMLHVWHSQITSRQSPASDCHRHEWDLTSYVLAGRLRNVTYQFDEGGSASHRLYRVGYDGNVSLSEAMPCVGKLKRSAVDNWSAGQIYHVPRGVFHSTIIPKGVLVSTIVLTHNAISGTGANLRSIRSKPQYRYERRPCDQATYSKILNDVNTVVSSLHQGSTERSSEP